MVTRTGQTRPNPASSFCPPSFFSPFPSPLVYLSTFVYGSPCLCPTFLVPSTFSLTSSSGLRSHLSSFVFRSCSVEPLSFSVFLLLFFPSLVHRPLLGQYKTPPLWFPFSAFFCCVDRRNEKENANSYVVSNGSIISNGFRDFSPTWDLGSFRFSFFFLFSFQIFFFASLALTTHFHSLPLLPPFFPAAATCQLTPAPVPSPKYVSPNMW